MDCFRRYGFGCSKCCRSSPSICRHWPFPTVSFPKSKSFCSDEEKFKGLLDFFQNIHHFKPRTHSCISIARTFRFRVKSERRTLWLINTENNYFYNLIFLCIEINGLNIQKNTVLFLYYAEIVTNTKKHKNKFSVHQVHSDWSIPIKAFRKCPYHIYLCSGPWSNLLAQLGSKLVDN